MPDGARFQPLEAGEPGTDGSSSPGVSPPQAMASRSLPAACCRSVCWSEGSGRRSGTWGCLVNGLPAHAKLPHRRRRRAAVLPGRARAACRTRSVLVGVQRGCATIRSVVALCNQADEPSGLHSSSSRRSTNQSGTTGDSIKTTGGAGGARTHDRQIMSPLL